MPNPNSNTSRFIEFGDPHGPWQLNLRDEGGNSVITDTRGASPVGFAVMVPVDNQVQEDTIVITWTGPASLVIDGQPVDFLRETNGDLVLELNYQVLSVGASYVVADIGGTNARFALYKPDDPGITRHHDHVRFRCSEFCSFAGVFMAYLEQAGQQVDRGLMDRLNINP